MKCPHDETPLFKRVYEADIQIDECSKCNGMWLEKGELEQIQQTRENDYREELGKIPERAIRAYKVARELRSHESLNCPRCDDEMAAKEYGYCSQIYVDVCPNCHGVWLEEGELKALEVFFERSQLDTRELRKGFWASLSDLLLRGVVPKD